VPPPCCTSAPLPRHPYSCPGPGATDFSVYRCNWFQYFISATDSHVL